MKVLITTDFYTDFGLIEVPTIETAINYLLANLKGEPVKAKIIGTSDNLTTEDATSQAEAILFISDFESED